MPLSYVVRENDDPAHDRDFGEVFQAEMIACAPLHGAHYRADARCVHQLLKNYLVAETAEQWIKGLEVHGDGRRNMMALREHYSGEGNASRRIATAERMRECLRYKSECSLAFSIFLDRMQRMLTKRSRRTSQKMKNFVSFLKGYNTHNYKILSRHLKCVLTWKARITPRQPNT